MSINISVAGGVNFNAYLADFAANFVAGGRGFFSNNPVDLSGDEYALSEGPTLPVADGRSFIAESGSAGDLSYDFANRVIYGSLDGLEFGDGLAYDPAQDNFSTDLAVSIEGLGLSGLQSEGAANDVHELLLDLMNGETDVLLSLLKTADLNFTGSARADGFVGFDGDDVVNGGGGKDKLGGGAGDDQLNGGAGADKLTGGKGADVLAGGDGGDVFYFAKGSGLDVVTDFAAGAGKGDLIAFKSGQFADFDAVIDAASTNGEGDLVIRIDGKSSITLQGVAVGDLAPDDFLFG